MDAEAAASEGFDELDPDEIGGSTAGLSRAVLTDDQRDVGVPMLLHTADTLPGPEHGERFSTAAYLHQASLGRRWLEDGDPGEETTAQLLSLNFHAVPPEFRRTAEERIRRVLDLGEAYDPETGTDGPRVMVAIYDGDRSTGLWAAELCRRLGVRAYYFPLRHTLLEAGPRLTDDELATVAADHELCFHTATHRAAAEVTEDDLEAEVVEPLHRLTRVAGRLPRLGAWRGGARFDPGTLGDRTLRNFGVTHLVSNWSVEPIPPAAGLDPDTVS
ncbi:hypothetical protein [uncultured Friedmanniella sp.]|uniref:hypothetical protein n=1 Tax=uncultured Friedmanniella sp. TaxID=335381 RepID=UPI0035CC731D